MKRLLALLLIGITSVSCIAQKPHLSVSRCDNVVLPGAVESLSFCDEFLYLRIPQMLLSSRQLGKYIQSPEGDISTRNLGNDVISITRHPVTGNRFFTTKSGKCFQEIPRAGKEPKIERVTLSHFSGSIESLTFSSDGRWMIFASDSRDGLGGLDLWATCSDSLGVWLEPIHLDATVNSEGDESSPVLADDFLYYTASLPQGKGKALFSSPIRRVMPTESLPNGVLYAGVSQLLPPPINGEGENYSLVLNADAFKGYWLSTRDGEERLYQFEGTLRSSHVCGVVTDSNGNPLEGTRVTLRYQGRTVDTTTTLADGSYNIFLQFDKDYDLYYSKRDYFTEQFHLKVPSLKKDRLFNDIRHDITLSGLQYDTTVYYYNLFGNDAEEELSEDGCRMVEPLVRFMRENPHVVAAVSLRTDLTTDAAFNRLLGQHRIESLKAYISSQVANPNIVFYNDCDYDGGCNSATVNSILAVVLRTPDKK